MLSLSDVRDYIASLGLVNKVYIGKMDNKLENCIGVYERPPRQASVPLGGMDYSSYGIKHVSLLVHGNKKIRDTETLAYGLYNRILNTDRDFDLASSHIHYVYLDMDAPENVGTDDSGVYEYVIWLNFVYER